MSVETAFIGLGSNLGDSSRHIEHAIQEIDAHSQITVTKISSFYRSKAIGPKQPDFLNAVIQLQTILSPFALLGFLQTIEANHHRERQVRWGPRTLDCDILLYGGKEICSPELKIPHPEMKNRNFVILPLFEIAPDLILPDTSNLKNLVGIVDHSEIQRVQIVGA